MTEESPMEEFRVYSGGLFVPPAYRHAGSEKGIKRLANPIQTADQIVI
jgi:hypothetical protein